MIVIVDGVSDDTTARELAIKRLRQKQAFKGMLVTYVVINAFLWALWAMSGDREGVPWPLWVTVGWGIGVLFSAWSTYGQKPITEEAVQQEMNRTRGMIDPKD